MDCLSDLVDFLFAIWRAEMSYVLYKLLTVHTRAACTLPGGGSHAQIRNRSETSRLCERRTVSHVSPAASPPRHLSARVSLLHSEQHTTPALLPALIP